MSAGRNVLDVASDLMGEINSLFRNEVHLARAELSEKVSAAGSHLALIAAGALLLTAGAVILFVACVALLMALHFSLAAAAGIVGGVAAIAGLVVALAGAMGFRHERLAPDRTVRQLRRDAEIARREVTS